MIVSSLLVILSGSAALWLWQRRLDLQPDITPVTPASIYEFQLTSTQSRWQRYQAVAQGRWIQTFGVLTYAVWQRYLSNNTKTNSTSSSTAKPIISGWYECQNLSLSACWDKVLRGERAMVKMTFPEGWTVQQIRRHLAQHTQLTHTTDSWNTPELRQYLRLNTTYVEGWLAPDTYIVDKYSDDRDVLRLMSSIQTKRLQQLWAQRAANLPLRTPEEALIVASLVEKETGQARDRAMIAGVFINRLQLGMPMQSDPTVIYGIGDRFNGNLTRQDLRTDTPWNTYTRKTLPITPIANPGKAALQAVLHPATTDALYFVARGDGSSEFSATLEAHNRAVQRYQRGNR
jgi:UPF0755 protein